jgi:hypothetical protein
MLYQCSQAAVALTISSKHHMHIAQAIATSSAAKAASTASVRSHLLGSPFSTMLSVSSHHYSHKIFWQPMPALPKIHSTNSTSNIFSLEGFLPFSRIQPDDCCFSAVGSTSKNGSFCQCIHQKLILQPCQISSIGICALRHDDFGKPAARPGRCVPPAVGRYRQVIQRVVRWPMKNFDITQGWPHRTFIVCDEVSCRFAKSWRRSPKPWSKATEWSPSKPTLYDESY